MQSLNHFILITIALLFSAAVRAQGMAGGSAITPDVIGTSGNYTQKNSEAANTNRELANKLYQQALADEKAAWSTFPPNVGLLAKALNQSKEGKMADDQAKEFARAAMHGINSGGNSGDFKLDYYGVLPESKLKDLANGSSPFRGAVESKLGGYGMKLADDKMSIKTPMGNLPINMSMQQLEGGLRKLASSMGYNPDDVSKGLRASEDFRNGVANRLMAELNAKGGGAAGAGAGAAGGLNAANLGGAGDGEGKKDGSGAAGAQSAGGGAGADGGAFVQDDASRQAQLQKNREEFLKKMGAMEDPEMMGPLHGPNDDLFRVVHIKYQSLRGEGVFFESEFTQMMANAMKPASLMRSSQPAKVASRLPAASNGPIKPMVTPK